MTFSLQLFYSLEIDNSNVDTCTHSETFFLFYSLEIDNSNVDTCTHSETFSTSYL